MHIDGMTPVLPVDDLGKAVEQWAALLGTRPTFVDADRWAQFDFGGRRIALAGSDRAGDTPGLMIKVKDVAQVRQLALDQGLVASNVEVGAHETRCTVVGPGGWPIIFYAPLPRVGHP